VLEESTPSPSRFVGSRSRRSLMVNELATARVPLSPSSQKVNVVLLFRTFFSWEIFRGNASWTRLALAWSNLLFFSLMLAGVAIANVSHLPRRFPFLRQCWSGAPPPIRPPFQAPEAKLNLDPPLFFSTAREAVFISQRHVLPSPSRPLPVVPGPRRENLSVFLAADPVLL